MEIVKMKKSFLKPAPYNPRRMAKEEHERLELVLNEYGLIDPIIFNAKTGIIIGGNQRYQHIDQEEGNALILGDIGWFFTETDLKVENENVEKAMNISLNKIAGEFDKQGLNLIMNELKLEGYNLKLTGFADHEIKGLRYPEEGTAEEDLFDPDSVPEEESETSPGDIFILGEHKLICGDATESEYYDSLLGKERADMVFTDPPYGVDYSAKNRMLESFRVSNRNLRDIQGDVGGEDDLLDMLTEAFTNINKYSQNHCSIYVTCAQGGDLGMIFFTMMLRADLPVKHVLIWNKNQQNFSLGRLDYEYKHEPILYTWKDSHHFYGKGECTNSVWDIKKERSCKLHPTMKPIALIENALKNSSLQGDIILDTFGGSGSTLIACEQLGRICRMIELEPHYCEVIVKRWEEYTGQKAEVIRHDGG
jgi:DNA modification methylase